MIIDNQAEINRTEQKLVEDLVSEFEKKRHLVTTFCDQVLAGLNQSTELEPLVHSIKSRIKDTDHLRKKITRLLVRSREAGRKFDITKETLLTKIHDLAGIRILHLYTRQVAKIDKALKEIFEEQKYEVIEGPVARTWDDESRKFFKEIQIETQKSETMYTSVHYIIGSASRTPVTCEVQVRTLAEEVWGEVSHSLNYPEPVRHVACREQIKALARATSAVTRLVDSIFMSYNDLEMKEASEAAEKATSPVTKDTKPANRNYN